MDKESLKKSLANLGVDYHPLLHRSRIEKQKLKNFLYLDDLSHHTVMQQVRKQLAVELLDRAEKEPTRRHELYDFLAYEPVRMTPEIYNRMGKLDSSAFVIGHFRSPFILEENPKPVLLGYSPRRLAGYFRNYGKFLFMKIFLRALRKSLVFHEELRTMQFFTKNSASKP